MKVQEEVKRVRTPGKHQPVRGWVVSTRGDALYEGDSVAKLYNGNRLLEDKDGITQIRHLKGQVDLLRAQVAVKAEGSVVRAAVPTVKVKLSSGADTEQPTTSSIPFEG